MLRASKGLTAFDPEVDWSEMKSWIVKRVVDTFRVNPDLFLSKCDVCTILHSIANEELQLYWTTSARTVDGRRVFLVHQHYPPVYGPSGVMSPPKSRTHCDRGYYDLVILDPEFVANHALEAVHAEEPDFLSLSVSPGITPFVWICEVMFFSKAQPMPDGVIKLIEEKALRVKTATSCHASSSSTRISRMGSVIVFIGQVGTRVLDLRKQIMRLNDVRQLDIYLSTA